MDSIAHEDLIRYIMTNLDDAVCMTDRFGVLKYYNPAAGMIFGLSGRKQGHKIWEYIPFVETNDELIQLFIDAVQSGKASGQKLVPFENNGGERFHFRVSLRYQEENGGQFIIIVSDLTELVRVTDAFSRYTSPQIADYVLNTPEGSARNGESRDVTILMSDLRGFTAMSVSMEAGPLVEMVNHYFAAMTEVIDSFRGTVIEFLGDGIFVVFGAPKSDPRHADHAVACAVGMQNAMPEVNRWNKEHGFPALSMGIGISSGPCVVGNIGSSRKMKYGCVGESVNLAGRVESQTVAGQILVSETTAALVRGLAVQSRYSFLPKGARAPVTVCDVSGIGPDHRLELQAEEPVWISLKEPPVLSWFLLREDKSVDPEKHTGEVLSVSVDGRHLLLRSPSLPAFHQNLMIDIGEDLYGKVTGLRENAAVVSLTSLPKGFDGWFRALQ